MLRIAARLVLLFLFSAPALAQQPAAPNPQATGPLAPFFGRFTGTGLSAGEDIDFLGVTRRDLDIEIRPAGEGFTARWTTVLRTGPSREEIRTRRRESEATFTPVADRPGFYRGIASGDLFSGQTLMWARVRGTSLTITEITLMADGRLDQGIYVRTLTQAGMQLQFTRMIDGERSRIVRGRLSRQP